MAGAYRQEIELPVPNTTLADYAAAKGALLDAAAGWVDWERLHAGEPEAIGAPGRILLALADRLPR